jgi:hypothetical protein
MPTAGRESTMRRFILIVVLTVIAALAMGCPMNVTHHREDDGSLVYVGNFSNEGDLALTGADIQATAYDAAGNVMATASDSLCQILPGKGILPFEVTFPPGTGDPARVDFKVVGTPTAEPYLATGLEARVVAQTKFAFLDETWVTGVVTNRSSESYYTGYICASWTDANGNVVRVASGRTGLIAFPPGASIPFVLVEKLPPEAVNISFYLDAGVVPPGEPVRPVVSLPNTAFTNLFSVGYLFASPPNEGLPILGYGKIQNTTSHPISAPSISATYSDASGNLLGAGEPYILCPADVVPPGQFTFGGYQIVVPTGGSGLPKLQIQAQDLSGFESYHLKASDVRVAGGFNGAQITGKVKNASTKSLSILTVCGGVFDEGGDFIGASWVRLAPNGGLRPGASIGFTIDVTSVLGDPSSATAFGTGRP